MKDSKYFNLMLFSLGIFLILGISYAYFGTNIIGNETAKKQTVMTGDLELTFTDNTEISLDNAFPGDSFTKTISVKNTGTLNANYNLVWTELTNEIINDELVIEATCKRLNSSGTEEGTCEAISQTPIKSNTIKKNISIEPSITHEYTIKVTFIDTGSLQDYNKNKSFNGKLGINEYNLPTSVSFAEDSWAIIAKLVSAGEIDNYKVGDTKTVDLGTYGTHTLRIANTSTPSECSTKGFSQTACGFVLEFADIIISHKMNDTATNVGGWPASGMYTFVNNDIYNALPSDLKNVMIDTTVVSGHGTEDAANFTSTDKLYLFSPMEIYTDFPEKYIDGDSAKTLTRTLDYYVTRGVTVSNNSAAIKKLNSNAYGWWLRTADLYYNNFFYLIYNNGLFTDTNASITFGVSPAFRIG